MKFYQFYSIVYFLTIFVLHGQDNSINFDGNNDYILISDHNQLDLTDNYTIEAWIFPEQFTWLAGIVSKYQSTGANGYILRLTDQSPYSGLGFDEATTSIGVLNSNQWYHIAAVNNNGIRTIYINGTEFNLSGSSLNVSANSNPIRIGSDYGSRFFKGRIDEVRIWNVPRNQSEINELMEANLSGSENGLVAYYTFDEGSGDTLYDHSLNNHYGLLRGSPNWVDGHSLSGLIGDVNFDESINIFDAVMLVSIMLNTEEGSLLQNYACDVNQDDIIDIQDIIMLVQIVLDIDRSNRPIISEAKYNSTESHIEITSNGEIAGFQIESLEPILILNDVIPSGWSWNQKDNKIIAYSLDGSFLSKSFRIPLSNKVEIKKMTIAGWNNNSVRATKIMIPSTFELDVGPNPFNPRCNISFNVISQSDISLKVYNINGQFIKTIFSDNLEVGAYNYQWAPNNKSSGSYFIQVADGINTQTLKIVYLK